MTNTAIYKGLFVLIICQWNLGTESQPYQVSHGLTLSGRLGQCMPTSTEVFISAVAHVRLNHYIPVCNYITSIIIYYMP